MPICEMTPGIMTEICTLDGKWDAHIHTVYASGDQDITPDLTPGRVIAEAETIGLRGIVFTDHVRSTTSWINPYLEEIRSAARRTRVRVVPGVETKITPDGSLDIPSECLNGRWWITASVHSFRGGKQEWLSAMHKVLQQPCVTTLGHLGSLYNQDGADVVSFEVAGEELAELGRAIAQAGKLVEINARHKLPRPTWIRVFRQCGVRFCLASDSHSLSTVGRFVSLQGLVDSLAVDCPTRSWCI